MRGQPKVQSLRADRLGQLAQQIASGSHLHRGPVGELGVVQREAVMVLGHRHHIARAGVAEQLGPAIRIELGRGELGNQILVAGACLRPVARHVMGEFLGSLQVHVARIPLAAERRHREHAPMDEDAELGIVVPRRRLIGLECSPVGAERTLACAGLGFAHQALALGGVLGGGAEPLLVDLFRAECGGGRRAGRLRAERGSRQREQQTEREHSRSGCSSGVAAGWSRGAAIGRHGNCTPSSETCRLQRSRHVDGKSGPGHAPSTAKGRGQYHSLVQQSSGALHATHSSKKTRHRGGSVARRCYIRT